VAYPLFSELSEITSVLQMSVTNQQGSIKKMFPLKLKISAVCIRFSDLVVLNTAVWKCLFRNLSDSHFNTPNADLAQGLASFIETGRNRKAEGDSPHTVAKKKLMTFMYDISESVMKFPQIDQADVKQEIFNFVNKRAIASQ
jgi:hypothetical protein